MNNSTKKLAGIILFIFIALGIYLNADNGKRLEQIEEDIAQMAKEV